MSEGRPVFNSLDPGPLPPPKPTRRRCSCCKCMTWTFLLLLVAGVVYVVVKIVPSMLESMSSPHAHAYVKETSEWWGASVEVKPMIDENQTFDVSATVWAREPGEVSKDYDHVSEHVLFSDFILHGIKYDDKDRSAVVNLTIPLDLFKQADLFNYDLRASFVLHPTDSPLLNRVKSISTWLNSNFRKTEIPPRKSSPFPYDPTAPQELKSSLRDQAIDEMSVTIPLLQFHETQGSCPEGTEEARILSHGDDGESEESSALTTLESTLGRPILETHPFFASRTNIRVVRETRSYTKRSFESRQVFLRMEQCIAGVRWYDCERSFRTNGNFEVLYELEGEDDESEWAYAPYMTSVPYASGPHDLVPLPVNRLPCTSDVASASGEVEPESINVQWKISFRSVSPRSQMFHESVDHNMYLAPYNHSESDWQRAENQDKVDLLNGLAGHRHAEDAHPRFRLAVISIKYFMALPTLFLYARYWYTRQTLYGLSVPATLIASLDLIVPSALQTIVDGDDALDLIFSLGIMLFIQTGAFIMLFRASRLEITRRGRWIPTIQIRPSTHRERLSQRADFSWFQYGGLYLASLLVFVVIRPHEIILFSSGPEQADTEIASRLVSCVYTITRPLTILTLFCQRRLNHRLRVYTGQYKIGAFLGFGLSALGYVNYLERFVGTNVGVRQSTSLEDVFGWGLGCLELWQVFAFKSVKQEEEEDI